MNLKSYKNVPIAAKASIAYVICNIIQKSLSFLTLPLFTRLLTTEEYGQYSIYSSWHSILLIFLTLNLQSGSFQKAMVKYENNRYEYIASCQTITVLLSLLFIIVYLPFYKYFNKIFELPTYLMIIMVLDIILQTSTAFWMGFKRYVYEYKSVVVVTLIIAIAAPTFAYYLISNSDEKGYARILGYSLIYILVGIVFFISNYIKGKRIIDIEMVKYALSFNLPLIVYYLSQMIFNQSDRIMISHFSGIDKAGIYGVGYSLSIMLLFILNAINNSYVPWFYDKIRKGQGEENQKVASGIAILMAVLLLCIIWVAPELIYIIAGDQYSLATYVVPPVAMSLFLQFYSQLCLNVQFYHEEKKAMISASIGAAVINIVLNAIFIPVLGFLVAGYTTLISYIVFALSNYSSMKKTMKEKNDSSTYYNEKSLVIILCAFTIMGIIGTLLYNYLIIRIAFLIILVLSVVIYRNRVISIVKGVLRKNDKIE